MHQGGQPRPPTPSNQQHLQQQQGNVPTGSPPHQQQQQQPKQRISVKARLGIPAGKLPGRGGIGQPTRGGSVSNRGVPAQSRGGHIQGGPQQGQGPAAQAAASVRGRGVSVRARGIARGRGARGRGRGGPGRGATNVVQGAQGQRVVLHSAQQQMQGQTVPPSEQFHSVPPPQQYKVIPPPQYKKQQVTPKRMVVKNSQQGNGAPGGAPAGGLRVVHVQGFSKSTSRGDVSKMLREVGLFGVRLDSTWYFVLCINLTN